MNKSFRLWPAPGARLNRFCTLDQEKERVGDEVLLFWVNKHIGFAPKLPPLLFSSGTCA